MISHRSRKVIVLGTRPYARAGTQLGRYAIAAPLGTGGMGEVYRATDSRLDRQVAIKVLPPQFVQDQARLARFEREAKVVAALSHPNILGIHDFVTEQGQTFAVMELLEGETLRRRIDRGAIPWRKAVEIAVAIADGLAAAHAKGIIHRDLKPENIFLTTDGRVKILDFGLARIKPTSPSGDSPTGTYHPDQTEAGTILGTVGYMSPEQVRGQEADGTSDVFSLGCMLYEMVSGPARIRPAVLPWKRWRRSCMTNRRNWRTRARKFRWNWSGSSGTVWRRTRRRGFTRLTIWRLRYGRFSRTQR